MIYCSAHVILFEINPKTTDFKRNFLAKFLVLALFAWLHEIVLK